MEPLDPVSTANPGLPFLFSPISM